MDEKLPLKQIFIESIEMPFKYHRDLLRFGWRYALLFIAFAFIPETMDTFVFYIAYYGLFLLAGTLAMAGCHRVFLLPKAETRSMPAASWRSGETRFLFNLIKIVLLTTLLSAIIPMLLYNFLNFGISSEEKNAILTHAIFYLSAAPQAYFISRWSLILPASAIGNHKTLGWAWKISSGHSLRLFVLLGVIPLIANFIFSLLSYYIEPHFLIILIEDIIWLIIATIEICLLSLSYKWLIEKEKHKVDF